MAFPIKGGPQWFVMSITDFGLQATPGLPLETNTERLFVRLQSMAIQESKKVIYAAIATNIAIAICKYAAAALTGSSAMLAEAFHSAADTGNELLLLLGIKRSQRPPDPDHPFGHGKELYFWTLLVAVLIFVGYTSIPVAILAGYGKEHLK